MRLISRVFVSFIVGIGVLGVGTLDSSARPFRPDKIPNGRINSCDNCHVFPGGPRNAFGLEVEELVDPNSRAEFWGPDLAQQDADGDGFTNGEELQDPNGEWSEGDPQPGDPSLVTNPSDPEDFPEDIGPTSPADAWITALSGSTEGRGTAIFKLHEGDMLLDYNLNVFELENITASNILIGPPSNDGSIAHTLETPANGSSSGRLELTTEDIDNLKSGMLYVNVSTQQNPDGEISGQIMDEAPVFKAELNGEQQVPEAVETDATGTARLELSEDLATLAYELTIMNIQNVTAAHIHMGQRGENGDIIFPLADSSFQMISGEIELNEDQLATLLAEGYYINVHTVQNPPGEIRGQILFETFEEPTTDVAYWDLY